MCYYLNIQFRGQMVKDTGRVTRIVRKELHCANLQLQCVLEMYTRHSKSRDIHKIMKFLKLGCVCCSAVPFRVISFVNMKVLKYRTI